MSRPENETRAERLARVLPMPIALGGVVVIYALGAIGSFREQANLAAFKGFAIPSLLPLVLDGLAVSLAAVAWAASLDARPALAARLGTALAIGSSATSNGYWGWLRADHDVPTVLLAGAFPLGAFIAFEVLLGELRRRVQRARGEEPPVPIPLPRLVRFALSPVRAPLEWRRAVLEVTAPPRRARRARPDSERPAIEDHRTIPGSVVPYPAVSAAAQPRAVVSAPVGASWDRLLPDARRAAQAIAGRGEALTRDRLRDELRARGQGIGNRGASYLLGLVNNEGGE